MRTLRKLILGETWTLPIGVAVAVAVCFGVRALAGRDGWWHHAGGFVLLVLVIATLIAAVGRPQPR
jgi:membrane protein YdbS with pleckstrin-like domain